MFLFCVQYGIAYSGGPAYMEQNVSESRELESNFLTTFAFVKKRDGLEVSIVGCMELLPVSDVSGGVLGVIHFGGQVIPVVDLKKRFGLGSTEISDTACILLAASERWEGEYSIGIIVPDISNIVGIAGESMECSVDETGDEEFSFDGDSCHGLAKVLMNIEKVMNGIELKHFK